MSGFPRAIVTLDSTETPQPFSEHVKQPYFPPTMHAFPHSFPTSSLGSPQPFVSFQGLILLQNSSRADLI